MKSLSGAQIRNLYKQFFAERGHLVFPSASLVPRDDPTLLWINAGMAPLKPYFDGREIPEKPRIVSSQKCIRTNDIENVGHTARHQTFFEMLGNFSFGDYFKQDAIAWAWDFLTRYLEFSPERLSVTVHVEDDEAYELWNKNVGLPSERIFRGTEDNFWEIGEGPCGPCSEIFYDRGEEYGCGSETCQPGCDCDRFLEVWNLVFTQYNKEPDGSYTPLPKRNIDTGMGLERVASILQDVPNNFETDLFRPLMDETSRLCGVPYPESSSDASHHTSKAADFKIIADHIRTVTFAIGDGVLPGNEGRSYIIRRLLRRAVRSGKRLGIEKPFLHGLVPIVDEIMGEDYPDIREKREFIMRVVRLEEERFHETLSEGEALLMRVLEGLTETGQSLSGEDAFRLYDTYGFPIDITEEIAAEQGVTVDREAFERELDAQRERARNARQTAEGMNALRGALENLTTKSQFVGYHDFEAQSVVTALVRDGVEVQELKAGEEGELLLDKTPFYAQSGGQIADRGTLSGDGVTVLVEDVSKAPHGQNLHHVRIESGVLLRGQHVLAKVDKSLRHDTTKNHTATHLLHKALREVLGTHVAQAGSLVEPERLRFDFSHFGPVHDDELREVERRVNEAIWRDDVVEIFETDLDKAKALGAMALFGEKYGNRVRVVKAGDYSIELCGGCHVTSTGQIGMFCITAETGIGSGVRRIEAVTGKGAYLYVKEREALLAEAASQLKTNPAELPARISRLQEEMQKQRSELESATARLHKNRAGELVRDVQDVGGIPVLSASLKDLSAPEMRNLVDQLKVLLPPSIIVLASATSDKVAWVVSVAPELQKRGLHAGELVKRLAPMTGGKGGGRADMAQAGGNDVGGISKAVAEVPRLVKEAAADA